MTSGNDIGLEQILADAQRLLALMDRLPAPRDGSLREMQIRLARSHALGVVDQLSEILFSHAAPPSVRAIYPRAAQHSASASVRDEHEPSKPKSA